MNQITLEGEQVLEADIDLKNVSAIGNLNSPFLFIPIILKLRPLKGEDLDYGLFSVSAQLFVSGNNTRLKIADSKFEKVGTHKVVNETKRYPNLEFPLNRFSLKWIEENRIKNVNLVIELYCQFSMYYNDFLKGFENQNLRIEFSVPQSQWIERVNNKLGYLEYFLIEFPKGEKTISAIWTKLEQAETSFHHFDVTGLFAKCREIGSALDNHLKEALGSKSFSFKERWKRSYEKFSHYCSLPLHLEDMKRGSKSYSVEEMKILKHDCEHVLLLTKSLMKYAEELLSEEADK